MTKILKTPISRRAVLGGTAAAIGALSMPSILRAQDRSLKVGVYGGYFKDSFDSNIFPDFTSATGIAVESVAEPTGEAWLVQLEQAAKAGVAPADVSMMSQVAMLKGQSTELWAPIDTSKIANYDDLLGQFVN
ncbi:MAG: ABC transporter substrate-binding protein, partial [Alphaproteobacteria bacterium]|nr:ABC transporter substrate-binding protein [Alphaproteobacteria bacterium]